MQIGIMARTFIRPTLEKTLDAVVAHGIHCVQFNFTCTGLPEMPDHIDSKGKALCTMGAYFFEELEEKCAKKPNSVTAHHHLGLVYRQAGRIDDAIRELEEDCVQKGQTGSSPSVLPYSV